MRRSVSVRPFGTQEALEISNKDHDFTTHDSVGCTYH